MSDRFYRQQFIATGYAPGMFWLEPPKQNKQDFIKANSLNNLSFMTKKFMEAYLPHLGKHSVNMPEPTRLKKPYTMEVVRLTNITPSSSWTVAQLKELLNALDSR